MCIVRGGRRHVLGPGGLAVLDPSMSHRGIPAANGPWRCRLLIAAAGAEIVAEPTPTPWHSLNSRLEGPADLQLTLFSDLPCPLSEQASTAGPAPRFRKRHDG
jgi:AraC-like ligand binding domain